MNLGYLYTKNITLLLEKIKNDKSCKGRSSKKDFICPCDLHKDLQKFYELCNGVDLSIYPVCSYRILGIEKLKPINLLILDELCPEYIS